jgi:hypothetical protein
VITADCGTQTARSREAQPADRAVTETLQALSWYHRLLMAFETHDGAGRRSLPLLVTVTVLACVPLLRLAFRPVRACVRETPAALVHALAAVGIVVALRGGEGVVPGRSRRTARAPRPSRLVPCTIRLGRFQT